LNEKQVNRLIAIFGAGVAALVLAYFLTNLHRSVAGQVYAYTYNTVTGKMVTVCYSVNCSAP
jgi:hypothetical protein